MKTIIAIGAHHDDIELRAGGTLAKLLKSGYTVIYAIASTTPHYYPFDDEIASRKYKSNNEVTELRKSESLKAAEILGISEVHFFDFKSLYWYKEGTVDRRYLDGSNTTVEEFNYLNNQIQGREFIASAHRSPQAVSFLVEFLKSKNPDVVLTNYPDDGHWEHYATARFVYEAVATLRKAGKNIDLYAWEFGGAGSMLLSFAPTHLIDIKDTIKLKCESLTAYPSQFKDHKTDRFVTRAMERAKNWGKIGNMKYAEAFMQFDFSDKTGNEVVLSKRYHPDNLEHEL